MNITVCFDKIDPKPWIELLSSSIQGSFVSEWKPGNEPSDIAIVWEPTQQFIDEQKDLKFIFNIGAGVDSVLKLKLPNTVKVVKLDGPDISLQMAEYVCHAVIRHFRKFNEYTIDAKKKRWTLRKPRSRTDFIIGVMGLGNTGQRVAKALRVFDFPVNGYSRSIKYIEGVTCFSGKEQFSDFLGSCRVLVNLLPLTSDTEHILNRESLSLLPRGAYVINVARGNHLVERDLIELIDSGHLSGATLDVFKTEPLHTQHPFWEHPSITITPHIGARIMREETVTQIVSKIEAIGQGKSITGVIDSYKGY
jgi:glyoxylate/hydroxypyruvate reductase A